VRCALHFANRAFWADTIRFPATAETSQHGGHRKADWSIALVRGPDSRRLPPASEALAGAGETRWVFVGMMCKGLRHLLNRLLDARSASLEVSYRALEKSYNQSGCLRPLSF